MPPNQPATAIVSDGPYAYSRNPMYVAFLTGFVGLSLLAVAPVMLLMALPLFYFLDQHVIVLEKEYLAGKFGAAYTDYKIQVRRWL